MATLFVLFVVVLFGALTAWLAVERSMAKWTAREMERLSARIVELEFDLECSEEHNKSLVVQRESLRDTLDAMTAKAQRLTNRAWDVEADKRRLEWDLAEARIDLAIALKERGEACAEADVLRSELEALYDWLDAQTAPYESEDDPFVYDTDKPWSTAFQWDEDAPEWVREDVQMRADGTPQIDDIPF